MDAEPGRFTVGQLSEVNVVDASGQGLGVVQAVAFRRDGYATKVAVAEGDRLRFLSIEGAHLEGGQLRLDRTVPRVSRDPETE